MLEIMGFPDYQLELHKTKNRRDAARMADGILFALRISPTGTDLVIWLGEPSHRDNREAMTAWVIRECRKAGAGPQAEVRQFLLHRLVHLLGQIGDDVAL